MKNAPGNSRPVPPRSGQGDGHRLVPVQDLQPVLLPIAPPSLVNGNSGPGSVSDRDDSEHDRSVRGGVVSGRQPASLSVCRRGRLFRRARSRRGDAAIRGARGDHHRTSQRPRCAQPTARGCRWTHMSIESQDRAVSILRSRLQGACGSLNEPRFGGAADGGGTTGPMSPLGASSRSTITGA